MLLSRLFDVVISPFCPCHLSVMTVSKCLSDDLKSIFCFEEDDFSFSELSRFSRMKVRGDVLLSRSLNLFFHNIS